MDEVIKLNHNDKVNEWQMKFQQLQQQGSLNSEAEQLISELLAGFSEVQAQNQRLRKQILQKTTGDSRMSTKLREALYE